MERTEKSLITCRALAAGSGRNPRRKRCTTRGAQHLQRLIECRHLCDLDALPDALTRGRDILAASVIAALGNDEDLRVRVTGGAL